MMISMKISFSIVHLKHLSSGIEQVSVGLLKFILPTLFSINSKSIRSKQSYTIDEKRNRILNTLNSKMPHIELFY